MTILPSCEICQLLKQLAFQGVPTVAIADKCYGESQLLPVQFKTHSTQWNSCLVLLSGPEMYVWIDHRPYREDVAFSFCSTDTVINGPLRSYRVVHLPTPSRKVFLCCTWQLIQTDKQSWNRESETGVLSSKWHLYAMPLPWRKRGRRIVRVRSGMPVGKHYLLDVMRSLHPWTQSRCGFIDRPAREQASQKCQCGSKRGSWISTSSWGAVGKRWLLGKGCYFSLGMWLLKGAGPPLLQWMAHTGNVALSV